VRGGRDLHKAEMQDRLRKLKGGMKKRIEGGFLVRKTWCLTEGDASMIR
jgi:hypothetical protein